jgi:hypothetical protein
MNTSAHVSGRMPCPNIQTSEAHYVKLYVKCSSHLHSAICANLKYHSLITLLIIIIIIIIINK